MRKGWLLFLKLDEDHSLVNVGHVTVLLFCLKVICQQVSISSFFTFGAAYPAFWRILVTSNDNKTNELLVLIDGKERDLSAPFKKQQPTKQTISCTKIWREQCGSLTIRNTLNSNTICREM